MMKTTLCAGLLVLGSIIVLAAGGSSVDAEAAQLDVESAAPETVSPAPSAVDVEVDAAKPDTDKALLESLDPMAPAAGTCGATSRGSDLTGTPSGGDCSCGGPCGASCVEPCFCW